MPRNGSGVAEPVPGTSDAVPNTVIESAKYDALVADVYSIFNTAQPVSLGGTGGTDVLSAWDALAAQAVDIASAANINLDTATGPVINLTGTATVNSATLAVGHTRFVRATAASVLTASATFVINGSTSVNRTNAAGDLLLFIGGTGGTVRIWSVGSVSLASTTDVLTGTDASKAVTSDALAALWEKGSDVASAGTVSLGEGGLFHITGTTPITDIDFATPKNGRGATLIFDGALTLTHNATTLKLPGEANITTAAGDRCDIVQDSGDNIIVTNYTRATGAPLIPPSTSGNVLTSNGSAWVSSTPVAGGMTLVGTISTASGASQSLTSIPAGYKHLLLVFNNVSHNNGSNQWINIEISSDNGSSYSAKSMFSQSVSNATLLSGDGYAHHAGESGSDKIYRSAVNGLYTDGGISISREATVTGVINAIRISPQAGSFDSGQIKVYTVN